MFRLIFDDFFRENEFRYKFVNDFASGNVLDYSNNSLMSYYGSKILLNSNVTNVFHHNIYDEVDHFSCRSLKGNTIQFQNTVLDTSKSYFDCIFSNETINLEQNPLETISKLYDLLNDNGILIITCFNKHALFSVHEQSRINYDLFSKESFLKILNTKFSKIELFSQILINTSKSIQKPSSLNLLKRKLRFLFGLLYSVIDKKGNFYRKFLLDRLKTHDDVYDVILNEQFYLPVLNEEKHIPKFFIAVCYKNVNFI